MTYTKRIKTCKDSMAIDLGKKYLNLLILNNLNLVYQIFQKDLAKELGRIIDDPNSPILFP
jgi:hypothetical protein